MTKLNKFIAQSGLCSRRQADELIKSKKVKINGCIAKLGAKVNAEDEIIVNNKKIKPKNEKIYVALNKPIGYTCTKRNFKKEKNVFSLLPKELHHLAIAGRLDKNSEGLLLLTNDGELIQKITHPKFAHEKKYLVEVKLGSAPALKIIACFKNGIEIGEGDGVVSTKKIKYLDKNKFEITLTQGKKRQIRRMFEILGVKVISLKRIAIGNIRLDNLQPGKWRKFWGHKL